jgi:hypothetical protein
MADQTNLPVLSNARAYTRRKIIAGSAIGLSWLVIGKPAPTLRKHRVGLRKRKSSLRPRRSIKKKVSQSIPRAFTNCSSTTSSSPRFRAVGRPRFTAKSVAPSAFSMATSWDESLSCYPIAASFRHGAWFRGLTVIIRSPGLSSWQKVPVPSRFLITQGFPRNWQSIWRADGTRIIGRHCKRTSVWFPKWLGKGTALQLQKNSRFFRNQRTSTSS